jgi:hypothetical protein
VRSEVGFAARGTDAESNHLTGGHIQGWRSHSGCHGVPMRIPLAQRDRAASAMMGGGVRGPGCRSSHRCWPHAPPPQRALERPHPPHTPCRSAWSVRRDRREGE